MSNNIQPVISGLANARKAKALTQTELGSRLGLPQSYISRLESGRLDIRLSTAIEIARYLGLEIMMIPSSLTPLVNSLLLNEPHSHSQLRPLYTLEDLDESV